MYSVKMLIKPFFSLFEIINEFLELLVTYESPFWYCKRPALATTTFWIYEVVAYESFDCITLLQ